MWLGEAEDHLKIARKYDPELNLRLLCSEAHLGAEKAIKSVVIARGGAFTYTHDVGALLDEAEQIGETVPQDVRAGEILTTYSSSGRYPSTGDERNATTREEYDEAIEAATAVLGWATDRVETLLAESDESGTEIPGRPAEDLKT